MLVNSGVWDAHVQSGRDPSGSIPLCTLLRLYLRSKTVIGTEIDQWRWTHGILLDPRHTVHAIQGLLLPASLA
jgi:hypothetical protein